MLLLLFLLKRREKKTNECVLAVVQMTQTAQFTCEGVGVGVGGNDVA